MFFRSTTTLVAVLVVAVKNSHGFVVIGRLGGQQRTCRRSTFLAAKKATKKKGGSTSEKRKPKAALKGFGQASAKWEGCEDLRKWLVDRGAEVSAVSVGIVDDASGLRGVMATNNIARGDVLFSIPRAECILDEARADASPIAELLYPTIYDRNALPPAVRVALYILYLHRNPELRKEWRPVLDSFPSPDDFRAEGGPMQLWSIEEVNMVECGQMISEVNARKDSLREIYNTKVLPKWTSASETNPNSVLGGSTPPTFEEFQHAVVVVTSRAYGEGGGDDEGNRSMLVPGVDMVNHDYPLANANYGLAPWGDFVVLAVKPILKGEEINTSYGPLPNRLLLAQFGFMLKGSLASDNALVRIDGLFPETKADAATAATAESGADAEELWACSQAPARLEKLRVSSTDRNFRQAYRDGVTRRISRWQPAPTARGAAIALSGSEEEGTELYRGLLERELSAFSTTIDEDEQQLDLELSARTRLALSFRVRQKRLLRNEVDALDAEKSATVL